MRYFDGAADTPPGPCPAERPIARAAANDRDNFIRAAPTLLIFIHTSSGVIYRSQGRNDTGGSIGRLEWGAAGPLANFCGRRAELGVRSQPDCVMGAAWQMPGTSSGWREGVVSNSGNRGH